MLYRREKSDFPCSLHKQRKVVHWCNFNPTKWHINMHSIKSIALKGSPTDPSCWVSAPIIFKYAKSQRPRIHQWQDISVKDCNNHININNVRGVSEHSIHSNYSYCVCVVEFIARRYGTRKWETIHFRPTQAALLLLFLWIFLLFSLASHPYTTHNIGLLKAQCEQPLRTRTIL